MKIVLSVMLIDYIISLIAFIIQINVPDDSLVYFMAVDFSRPLRIVLWVTGFYHLLLKPIHLEYLGIASKLILFCIAIFTLDFIKNVLAYNGIYLWKELYAIKRIFHTGIVFWAILRVGQINKDINFINN